MFVDNTSAIALANSEKTKSKSKHIDWSDHYIRDHIWEGCHEVHDVSTTEMLVDFLTEPLRPQGIQNAIAIETLG